MFFASLPAKISSGANKDKPYLVEITSAKIQVANPDGSKSGRKYGDETFTDSENKEHVGILGTKWQYPQFGPEPARNEKGEYVELTEDQANAALQEMIQDAGGIVRLVENYNDATAKAALAKGKNYIRTKEDGEPDAIIAEGLRQAHDFTWAASERVTNKSVREGAEALLSEAQNLSKDELLARMAALLGKK